MKISENTIKSLATPSNYKLGKELFDAHEVEITGITTTHATARVGGNGTQRRKVELMDTSNGLSWKCTCIGAEKQVFCKHCVAVGLEVAGLNGAKE